MDTSLRIGMVGGLPKPYGGVATTCLELSGALAARGHQIYLWDRWPGEAKVYPQGIAGYMAKPRIGSYLIKSLAAMRLLTKWNDQETRSLLSFAMEQAKLFAPFRDPRTFTRLLINVLAMRDFFVDKNVDLLHGHHALADSFAALLVATKYFHCPFVVTVYGSEFTMLSNQKWAGLTKYVCENAAAVFPISRYTSDCMQAAGITPPSSTVIRLGVSKRLAADARSDLRKSLHLDQDTVLLLYVGWIIKRKGPQTLLDSLPLLTDLPWKAVFIGPSDGTMAELQKRAESLGIADRTEFIGQVSDHQLAQYYGASDIFVFPTLSKDEGFGLVALEAMLNSLPVVAARNGAIPEIVRESEVGLLFEPGNCRELAEKLRLLIDNQELRSQLGMSGRQIAETQYSWQHSANQVAQEYYKVLE